MAASQYKKLRESGEFHISLETLVEISPDAIEALSAMVEKAARENPDYEFLSSDDRTFTGGVTIKWRKIAESI